MLLDATDWATSQFQDTLGLDKWLQSRFALTAADRLIDRVSERPDSLQTVHRQRTRERMAAGVEGNQKPPRMGQETGWRGGRTQPRSPESRPTT